MKRIAAAMLGAATGAAFAQALPPVTVTATRTEVAPFDVPASVDVIDGARLRGSGRPEINLSEGIALVPGIAARDRQNFAQDLQLSIRGFGARSTFGVRGVRLYVDGIPATMPDGQGQLSHIDLASAGRVEVLRGPFSALYGNSSGGVLQVFTERGQGEPVITASMAAGSDGLGRPGLKASGSNGSLGYSVSANRMETDGFRDHSAASRGIFNARLDLERPGGDWMLVANALALRADDPLGLSHAQFDAAPRSADPSAALFNTRKTVRQEQLGLVHEHAIDASNRLRFMLYGGTRDTVQFQSIPTAAQASPLHPGGVIGLGRSYAGVDLRWTSRAPLAAAPLEIVAGLSLDTLREHRQGWQNFVGLTPGLLGALRRDEDNRVTNVDPYLQGTWKLSPRWTLLAGVRHSAVRFSSEDRYLAGTNGNDSGATRYGATLPAAGLMLAISPQLHAWATVGRGFETPTFNELAYRPDGTPGLNFALKPSRSRNAEIGLKGRGGSDDAQRIEWSVAAFQTATRDELVTQTNTGGRTTFQNAGGTQRRGVELAWTGQWARGWRAQLAQTWLDARYRDAFATCSGTPCAVATTAVPAGNRIPGVAQSSTAAELAWEPPRGWRAGADLRRTGRVFVNDANSDAAPAFTVLGLYAGYVAGLKRWTMAATVRIDNATDRRYAGSVIVNEGNGRYFEPAPGRTALLKLAASYAF
jgi:iron complex outermembrane receptor protein